MRRYTNHAGFPFDFAQGGESFDFAQDREPVEPRISPAVSGLVRNDGLGDLWHRLLWGETEIVTLRSKIYNRFYISQSAIRDPQCQML
jgi:hypothetical protein